MHIEQDTLPAAEPATEQWLRRIIITTATTAVTLAVLGGTALAGGCPADQIVAAGHGQEPGATMPKDVTDDVLGSIDLGAEAMALDGRQLRFRELVVQPGGEVPWHSHDDRPAIIYIADGAITEYASNCLVPIDHTAGEVAMESVGLAHWWRNNGDIPARLLAADVFNLKADDHSH